MLVTRVLIVERCACANSHCSNLFWCGSHFMEKANKNFLLSAESWWNKNKENFILIWVLLCTRFALTIGSQLVAAKMIRFIKVYFGIGQKFLWNSLVDHQIDIFNPRKFAGCVIFSTLWLRFLSRMKNYNLTRFLLLFFRNESW